MPIEDDGLVLVIGAGAAGLAVSKCLSDLQVRHDVVDRYGEVGGAYLRMYPRMRLSSPPRFLCLPGLALPQSKGYLCAREYASYLKSYAAEIGVKAISGEVVRVERVSSGFSVTLRGESAKTYASVVICTGSFDKPNIPTIPGLNDDPSDGGDRVSFCHACDWKGPEVLTSGRLLIVGGGMTAIELAEECVHSGIRPILSFKPTRGKTFPPQILGVDPRFFVYPIMRRLPLGIFRRQCLDGWAYRGIDRGYRKFSKRGLIDIRPRIEEVVGRSARFSDGSAAEVDHIVFATGYRWDMPFLSDSIPRGLQGNPLLKKGESVACPGLFCVGITCAFSASSHFIHGIAEDAMAVAKMIEARLGLTN